MGIQQWAAVDSADGGAESQPSLDQHPVKSETVRRSQPPVAGTLTDWILIGLPESKHLIVTATCEYPTAPQHLRQPKHTRFERLDESRPCLQGLYASNMLIVFRVLENVVSALTFILARWRAVPLLHSPFW
jgi:hypothetical protein